jgi:uncharacterized membrane protein
MKARVLAAIVGVFYTVTGMWSFFVSTNFYSTVADFAPYNLHFLHDVGAFQVGLGVVLLAAAAMDRGLVPALIGVLAGSLLHLAAHLLDIRLGGHPTTDLPALTLIAVVLAVALYLELRHPGARTQT